MPNDYAKGLRAENLACAAGRLDAGRLDAGRLLFENLSFALLPGERLDVSGRNGSGKTTLLAILAGIRAASEGQVHYDGLLHYVGHENALCDALSCEETLAFWARLYGARGRDEISEIAQKSLAFADLLSLRRSAVGFLSAGQKRRLALSRLVMTPRPLWILDEAEQSLDHEARDKLRALIRRHLARGGMLIAAGHGKTASAAKGIPAKRVFLGERGEGA